MERGHFWFESRNELLIWALKKYFTGMRSFLEIGCGTGFVLARVRASFPQAHVAGSEIFREGLAFAAGRMPATELLQMDAREIPFAAEFDVVAAFDVLEHIEEDEKVLQQMYAAVKPGGGIIITVPQHPWLWSGMDDYSFHKRRYTKAGLMNKVGQAGFGCVWTTSFTTLLLPAMMFSRWRLKGYTEGFDPQVEYRSSIRMNKTLSGILTLERHLIRRRISLPFGGSLLLVAMRGKE